MVLAELKQFDQKNRLHINCQYLELCGIPKNGNVIISVNTKTKTITVKPISSHDYSDVKKKMDAENTVKDFNTKSKIENFC